MKRLSNLANIVLLMLISAVMLIFTIYSRDNAGLFSQGNIINIVFWVFMTLGMLFITVLYLGRSVNMTNDLRRAEKYLAGNGKWRELSFKSKHLISAFRNYCKDMDDLEGHSIDCDISDYINARMMNQIIQKNLCESVSASMTGFGMLGTFIGLIIGLHGFSTNYSEMQNSIMVLLNGMKTAFLTSIYGVTFSLVFNYIYRKTYHSMTNALDSFCEEFYRHAVGNVQEDVNRRLVASHEKQTQDLEKLTDRFEQNLAEISGNISHQIESYLSELNSGVSDHLERSLSFHMEQSRYMVEEYLKNMNDKVLDVQLEKLNRMFNSFEAMSLNAVHNSEALKAVADSLIEQHESFRKVNAGMLELTEKLTTSAEELKRYQQSVAESQLEYSRQMLEYKTHMDESSAEFNGRISSYMDMVQNADMILASTIKALDSSVQEVSSGNAEMLAAITQNEKQLELTGNQLEFFLASASELTERVKHNSDDVAAYISTAKETSEKVAESIHTAVMDDFRTSSEHLSAINDELKQTSVLLSQTYRDINSGLADTFRDFDRNTAGIAEHFTDMLENMRDTADYIPCRLNDALNVYFNDCVREKECAEETSDYASDDVEHSADISEDVTDGVKDAVEEL